MEEEQEKAILERAREAPGPSSCPAAKWRIRCG
jgi:hypothetical protein